MELESIACQGLHRLLRQASAPQGTPPQASRPPGTQPPSQLPLRPSVHSDRKIAQVMRTSPDKYHLITCGLLMQWQGKYRSEGLQPESPPKCTNPFL